MLNYDAEKIVEYENIFRCNVWWCENSL